MTILYTNYSKLFNMVREDYMAATFQNIETKELDNKNKVVTLTKTNAKFLLQRQNPDTRWHVFHVKEEDGVLVRTGEFVDRSAYSNDLIEKIQLGHYGE